MARRPPRPLRFVLAVLAALLALSVAFLPAPPRPRAPRRPARGRDRSTTCACCATSGACPTSTARPTPTWPTASPTPTPRTTSRPSRARCSPRAASWPPSTAATWPPTTTWWPCCGSGTSWTRSTSRTSRPRPARSARPTPPASIATRRSMRRTRCPASSPPAGKDVVAGFVHKLPLFFGLDRVLGELMGETRLHGVSRKGEARAARATFGRCAAETAGPRLPPTSTSRPTALRIERLRGGARGARPTASPACPSTRTSPGRDPWPGTRPACTRKRAGTWRAGSSPARRSSCTATTGTWAGPTP